MNFYLVQGHTLKKSPNDSLVFFSLGYANEIPLPNTGYHLYNCRSLTIPLVPQEEARQHRCFWFAWQDYQKQGQKGRNAAATTTAFTST
jgi:hypothetical protein